ncbi:MAG: nucleotidyltransferase domain-containing protein [Ruminococcus sp.]|jgi:predicted nucleotidyltransferase|nr:nucleotidyltransferase domain-containing protein [Ruminococcus sp.]
MAYHLDEHIKKEIIALAQEYGIKKVVLFGSRARGTNRERSDIDLAVSGGDITRFSVNIDEEIRTLLMFDVVDLDAPVQPALREEISRDGVVLYEEVCQFL